MEEKPRRKGGGDIKILEEVALFLRVFCGPHPSLPFKRPLVL